MVQSISLAEKIVASVAVALVLLFTAYSQWMLSNFQQLFAGMNIDLPLSTRLVLETYRWWSLLAVGSLAGIYAVIAFNNRAGWWPIAVAVALSAILFPLIVRTMYAPIMG